MTTLQDQIEAYEKERPELEAAHLGKWVVFHNEQLQGVFDSFDDAAKVAVQRFGRGPYLIRQVGAAAVTLPASVMYNLRHDDDRLRV